MDLKIRLNWKWNNKRLLRRRVVLEAARRAEQPT